MVKNVWHCAKCGTTKKGNLKYLCDSCYQRGWYAENREHRKEQMREWRKNNKKKYRLCIFKSILKTMDSKVRDRILLDFGYKRMKKNARKK